MTLAAGVADDDQAALTHAVAALFADGPSARLHATITRPDGTHRNVTLRPLSPTTVALDQNPSDPS